MKEKKQEAVKRQQKKRRARRSGRSSGFWFRFLTLAAVVVAIVCCMTLFFQVREIEVQGQHLYTQEQVVDASGISLGDNLVSVKKAGAASLIMSALPFVESVHIERQLPDKVIITVTESDVTFALRRQNEQYYLLNAQGKILQELATADASDYPNLEGLTLQEPSVGAEISVPEEEQEAKQAALQLMQLLGSYGIAGSITRIDVTKPYEIRLECGSQYEILLGGSDKLDYKVEYLVAVLQELGEGKSGVIDLTFEEEKKARFQPYH